MGSGAGGSAGFSGGGVWANAFRATVARPAMRDADLSVLMVVSFVGRGCFGCATQLAPSVPLAKSLFVGRSFCRNARSAQLLCVDRGRGTGAVREDWR